MKFGKLLSEAAGSRLSNIEIAGVTSDSRKVKKGFVFVCIAGAAGDGHDYAVSACEAGAAVVVCERDLGLDNKFLVNNTRIAYAEMSAEWFSRPADKMTMIGVTGTNGKTSITYMLKAILEKSGKKVGLIGTIQNLAGDKVFEAKTTTPGAYELQELLKIMYDNGCTHVVMEASSHALDQYRNYGIHYKCALFTNLTQDHLDYHKTMENYAKAKHRLFENCDIAVVNYDDPASELMVSGLDCEKITYSVKSDEATYSAKNIVIRAGGSSFDLVGYDTIVRVKMNIGGKFSVNNAMCAAACALRLGISPAEISEAMRGIPGIKGRAEVVNTGRDFTVIIDYAHTPDGLKNILQTFRDVEKNRLVALFGCGGDRDKTKRPIMGSIATTYADYVIITSDNPRTEDPNAIIEDILAGVEGTKTPYKVIENREQAIHFAIQNACPGDIIILAGKGHETYQVLNGKTIHFDEREIIKDALEER